MTRATHIKDGAAWITTLHGKWEFNVRRIGKGEWVATPTFPCETPSGNPIPARNLSGFGSTRESAATASLRRSRRYAIKEVRA